MHVKCKLCGKKIKSGGSGAGGIFIEVSSEDQFGSRIAQMSQQMLNLMQHLFTEHPEEAFEIYSELSSKLNELFEIVDEESFSL